eukprot:SAG11_NODE_12725_length_688_cov_2.151104_1_plen_173_part_10
MGEQLILSESVDELEVEIDGSVYLVDIASSLVFRIAPEPEEAEVGRWDAPRRRILFDGAQTEQIATGAAYGTGDGDHDDREVQAWLAEQGLGAAREAEAMRRHLIERVSDLEILAGSERALAKLLSGDGVGRSTQRELWAALQRWRGEAPAGGAAAKPPKTGRATPKSGRSAT